MSRPTGHQPGLTSASDAVNQTNIVVYATWDSDKPVRTESVSSSLLISGPASAFSASGLEAGLLLSGFERSAQVAYTTMFV
jgi:hypothetical protein